jgi:hypothetical protein
LEFKVQRNGEAGIMPCNRDANGSSFSLCLIQLFPVAALFLGHGFNLAFLLGEIRKERENYFEEQESRFLGEPDMIWQAVLKNEVRFHDIILKRGSNSILHWRVFSCRYFLQFFLNLPNFFLFPAPENRGSLVLVSLLEDTLPKSINVKEFSCHLLGI